MIDFQNRDIKLDVFRVFTRFELLFGNKVRPIFITKQTEDKKWSCSLELPDLETVSVEGFETEIKAINQCAKDTHRVLNRYEDDDEIYYPGFEKSNAKEAIEAFFDEVEYSNEYTYQLCSEMIDLSNARKSFKSKLFDMLLVDDEFLAREGKEIYKISDYVSVTYLIRKKKKNYC